MLNSPLSSLTATWNNAGATFEGIDIDVTATAYQAASRLFVLKVGGVAQFDVDVNGAVLTGEWQATDVAVLHGGTGASDAGTARTNLGLAIGSDVQAWDAQLDTWATVTPSANGQSLVSAANYAAMRTLLDLEAGTDFYSIAAADAAFQPLDTDLTAIAALANTDGNFIVGNGSAWVAESGATARTSLGLGTGDSPTFAGLDLGGGTITNAQLEVANVSGATYTTAQHMQDTFHSAGVISGGGITDDADGTITVAAGAGTIRATDSDVAEIPFTDWAAEAGANVALTDNDMNYIYVEYNAGSPQVVSSITERTDYNTNIFLGTVYREGTGLTLTTSTSHIVSDHANKMLLRMKQTMPFARVSGGVISEVGTRNIAATAGSWWEGLVPFTTTALDTSVAGTFLYYYQDGAGGFTEVASSTQIDNTQYDNTSGTLAALSNNRYGVHWVYIGVDSEYYVVYGLGDYTLSNAENAGSPSSLPPHFAASHARLIGKIIIKKSASVFTSIESAFDTTFDLATPTDHGGLVGLQGGTTDEYYHLTSAQHTELLEIAGLSPVQGDVLYHNGSQWTALVAGTSGQFLQTQGGGANPLWATPAGSGNVSNTGTPVNNQLAVWTAATTIEGDVALTFDTTTDTLAIGASGKLAFGAVDILSDSAGTTTLSNIDALDATTEATIEAAIDTLANLTSAASLVTVGTLSGLTATGVIDFGGATSFEIPNGAAPTVNADGEIALDTTVTDWSHSIVRYFGGEEMFFLAMPVAQLVTPGDGEVVAYNATNDELEFVAAGAGGGDLWSDAVDSDIVPTGADSTYDLGTTTDRFAEAYIDTLYITSTGKITTTTGDLTLDAVGNDVFIASGTALRDADGNWGLYNTGGFTGLWISTTQGNDGKGITFANGGAATMFEGDYSGGTLGIEGDSNGSVPAEVQLYSNRGGSTDYQSSIFGSTEVDVTLTSGATVTASNVIPANVVLIGITTRIDVAAGTSNGTTGYNVGDGTDADMWGAITGTAIGTSSDTDDYTAAQTLLSASARTVTLTAVGGNFDGTGTIKVTAHYLKTKAA